MNSPLRNNSLLVLGLLVLSRSLMVHAHGTDPKPPEDDQDYGHLERPIGLGFDTDAAYPGLVPST